MWLKATGQIECDVETCRARFGMAEDVLPQVAIINAARISGWHCFRGPSITDKELDLHVCPTCMNRSKTETSKAKPLPQDVPMLDVDGRVLIPD